MSKLTDRRPPDGTNAEEGRKILADAGKPNIYPEARCSTARSAQWSWRSDRSLERTGRSLPQSPIHAAGEDLDLIVDWCRAGRA